MSADAPVLLVVDDNEDNRYTLTRRLKRQGHESIVEAVDGHDALEKLRQQNFDLVLLDVMMPEMNGYEVLERIKADPALCDIPVIMISALDEMDSVVKCIELGAEDYLPKPFNPTLLRARVNASLEKKKLRDQETSYMEQLEIAHRRADDLLHAILPDGAVNELKTTDEVKPRRYDDVSVLFCDIVDFTEYCDRHSPEKVVSELQTLVLVFEDIVHRHGMEKIKTIGDAFLATGGLLHPHPDAVLASVRCGLDMVAASKELEPYWQVRVGIHSGPVVAGIVGRRKFLFDLWGDTVNVASRISDQAAPGSVVTSSETWMQIHSFCQGHSLGKVNVKGKGQLELVEVCSVGERVTGLTA